MTAVAPKTIDLIQKLLRLAADGGATEAEAELAMVKAQELMAAHNLTVAELVATGQDGEPRLNQASAKNLMYPWKRDLLKAIADVNFCHLSLTFKRTKSGQQIGGGFNIIGRQSNVAAVNNMFDYLTKTIERLVVAEVGTSPQDRFTKYAHSFRLGAADRLKVRLERRHRDMLDAQEKEAREREVRAKHPAAPTGTSLVAVMKDFAQDEEDLNNDMLKGYTPGTTAARRAAADIEYTRRQAERQAKALRIEAENPGINKEVALWVAGGWERDAAERALGVGIYAPKEETPAEKAKRQAREEKANQAYWNRQDAAARKIDQRGYQAGSDRARDVGFDPQVTKNSPKQIR